MSLRDTIIITIVVFVFIPLFILSVQVSFGQVMQSASYKIESDSVNFGGGLSTSTSYNLESTEGEGATGDSGSPSFNMKAGYQQMTTTFISMTAPGDVLMSPAISGVTGGTANGSTSVTITTDNAAGYTLSISSPESPAMQKGSDNIFDYVPSGAVPDFSFTTETSDSHFGYSPDGVDITSNFLDNGSAPCGSGILDTSLSCWNGLSITSTEIARRASANTPDGSLTVLNFRVGIGGSVVQTAGVYTATTTLTALPL